MQKKEKRHGRREQNWKKWIVKKKKQKKYKNKIAGKKKLKGLNKI